MSSAFDMIHGKEQEIFDEDEMRILRVLLSETTLEVKVDGAETKQFKSNIGSPQCDNIS